MNDSPGTHQATGVARHLHFPVGGGSAHFLAIQDLTDVGISGALHAGVGFFGLLNAAPASLPCGLGDHEQRGPGWQLFHVLHSIQMSLGPLCTPAVLCSRQATLDGPDLTACRFGLSLNQPRMAHFSVTMLTSVQLV